MAKRMTKTDWLDFGLQRLAHHGVEALKVASLCEAAGKTIGSFYHHFDDQPAYFEALLSHWKQKNTLDVMARVDAAPDPQTRADDLNEIAQHMNTAEEVGIRAFAAQNPTAAAAVRDVDDIRVQFLQSLYQARLGLAEREAFSLARLEYAAFVGTQTIWPETTIAEGQALSALFQTLVKSHYR